MTDRIPESPMEWRVAPAGSLLDAEFDGQTVVYHTGAGHTHWVSPVAAEVLYLLGSGPRSEAALYADLSAQVSPDDLPMLADTLRETLDELRSLTLVEAV